MVTGGRGLFPGGKAAGAREANQPTLSNAELRICGAVPPFCQYVFMRCII